MDPYEILDVPRNATPGQIKQAYRRLARIWHPDRNPAPQAKAQFQRIQLAHDQLTGKAKPPAVPDLPVFRPPSTFRPSNYPAWVSPEARVQTEHLHRRAQAEREANERIRQEHAAARARLKADAAANLASRVRFAEESRQQAAKEAAAFHARNKAEAEEWAAYIEQERIEHAAWLDEQLHNQ